MSTRRRICLIVAPTILEVFYQRMFGGTDNFSSRQHFIYIAESVTCIKTCVNMRIKVL